MPGEKLAKVICEAKTKDHEMTDILFGKVTSVNPLRIQVDNRFTIEGNFIVLSQMVQNFSVRINVPTVTATHGTVNSVQLDGGRPDVDAPAQQVGVVTGISTGTQEQEVQIFRALQVGERVRMIRGQKSQLFYVLERG